MAPCNMRYEKPNNLFKKFLSLFFLTKDAKLVVNIFIKVKSLMLEKKTLSVKLIWVFKSIASILNARNVYVK